MAKLPVMVVPQAGAPDASSSQRSSAMIRYLIPLLLALTALLSGCADTGGTKYGERAAPVSSAGESETARYGRVTAIETVQVDKDYKFGVGTVVGAVAGGILGHQFGGGSGKTLLTIAGTLAGAAAGTAAESKMNKQDAQKVTVKMQSGGTVTIVQPVDSSLRNGMNVRVIGGGESARVVPR
jgi:outer membrane lipoprotein SlyB